MVTGEHTGNDVLGAGSLVDHQQDLGDLVGDLAVAGLVVSHLGELFSVLPGGAAHGADQLFPLIHGHGDQLFLSGDGGVHAVLRPVKHPAVARAARTGRCGSGGGLLIVHLGNGCLNDLLDLLF